MAARETVCLKRLGGDRGGEEAAGRFFANPKVTVDRIIESWSQPTGPAAQGRHVLAIHDCSAIKFLTRAERRRGLGMVGHGNIHGLLVHAMLAVDADSGACLGLVGGDVWNRDGKVTPLRNRVLSERESRRWVETAERAKAVLSGARSVTVMGDAESDLFPMWATLPELNFHLLIRAQADRRLADGGTLFTAADKFRVAGRQVIELPARSPDRPARTAKVEIRFGEVAVRRPANEKDRTLAETVSLRLVEVRETRPPKGVEPIHWRLLTTHEVNTEADAWRIVSWYQARWIIEQLFRVMKSQGLGLEDSQMATAGRLLKLAAVATKAACVIMQLVQERDGTHGLPASVAFDEAEIDTVEAVSPSLEGKTERQKNPHPPRSLARASWVMARLGGWNCYYKPAGPITMRRGKERFHAIHQGRLIGSKWERDVRLL
jgi:Transposase DDE domain